MHSVNWLIVIASDEGKVKMKLEYRDILDCLKRHPSSCVALKPTSLISYKLIKDIADEVQDAKYPAVDFSRLVLSEKMERVTLPLTELAIAAAQIGARLLIDAEQSELQPAVDLMALYLMQKVNKNRSIVYNTYQLYLQDSGLRALAHQKWLHENGANFAAKFVRGAYLSHEFSRQKSSHPNYRLCASKALTDQNYNENALMFCGGQDPIIFATHNAGSVKMIGSSIIRHRRQNLHEFAYLMGFRHRISEVLSGFKTLEYVPYGPTDVKIPYLLRRLEENADIMSK